MAHKAYILARKHGGKKLELILGPELPVREVRDAFKANFCRSRVNEKYEYAELHIAPPEKKRILISPKAAAAKAQAAEEAAINAELEAEQKRAAAKPTETKSE